jgi:hypothetical protein
MVVVEGAGRAGTKRTIATSVDRVDRTVAKQWKQTGVTPAPGANDEAFIRRVTLDLAGRIPTSDEVEAFTSSTSKDRRAKLVERLLASDDYAEHWADVYMDVLFTRASRAKVRYASEPRDYLVDSFATNTPFDSLATELISSTGDKTTNAATSFALSYRPGAGKVELLAGDTARIFLGVGIQCAQCHDHPYDKQYKKSDFAAFAANFSEVRTQPFDDPLFGRVVELSDGNKARGPYKSDVPAMLGTEVARQDDETRRQALARSITESELFSLVTVNRTWAQLFGTAIVSPWDDLGGENDDSHTPLLKTLAEDFRRHGYDHSRLLEVIVLSDAYGLAAAGGSATSGRADDIVTNFGRAAIRPLSPDQLLRSQLTVTGLEALIVQKAGEEKAAARRAQILRQYLFTFSDDEAAGIDTFTGNVPQVLLQRNGLATNRGVRARRDTTIWTILQDSDDPAERITALFVAAYARAPSATELVRYTTYVEDRDGDTEAYEDLFHALITSTEFATNH